MSIKIFQARGLAVLTVSGIAFLLSLAHPKICPSYIAKMVKGITARKLLIEFPHLRQVFRKGHLWNSSYYIETIGSISEEAIRRYIEKQKRESHDNHSI